MRHRICAAMLALALLGFPAGASAGEGDPLLSVDDLLTLEDSFNAFLDELEALLLARGLLSEGERADWRAAQLGDFFQNGGYGSILAQYAPGALNYARAEDTLLTLEAAYDGGTVALTTVRRYTPQDSSLPGLMLTLTVNDAQGAPLDVVYGLHATSGIYLKWDALLGGYVSVGATAESDGETVVWSDQTPALNANDPVLAVDILDAATREPIAQAALSLTVEDGGFTLGSDALSVK